MVIVTGNVDPAKLIMALAMKGKRPEIKQIQDVHPEQPASPVPTSNSQNQPTVEASQESSARELSNHQMANIDKLKQVEPTHSKSVRMTFKATNNDSEMKNKNVIGDSNEPHAHCGVAAAALCSVASDHRSKMNHTLKYYHYGEVSRTSRAACSGTPHRRNYGGRPSPTCCIPLAPPFHHNHHVLVASIQMTYTYSDHHVPEGPEAPTPLAHPYRRIFAGEHLGRCNLM